MERSLTLNGVTLPRILSFAWGLGMIVASVMTIEHYFAANFPETILCRTPMPFRSRSSSHWPQLALASFVPML